MKHFPKNLRRVPVMTALCAALFLAACESDQEKAERYYQSGLALSETGDTERALLELRNVFNHDGFHKDARFLYANLLRDQGRIREAYGQYLRLVEQYPNTLDVRITLANMAIAQNNWEEVERHGTAAFTLDPQNIDAQAIKLTLDYRTASVDRNDALRKTLSDRAASLLEETRAAGTPDNAGLTRIVIDYLINGDNPPDALPALDAALQGAPDALDLNMLKARLLSQMNDIEGTGAQLKRMTALYPDNTEIREAMIRWHMSQRDFDGAEAFLRGLAGDITSDNTEGHATVVQLLQATQGTEAARAEMQKLIDANAGTDNGRFYVAMQASADFAAGERETAIASVRAALDGAEPSEQTRRLQNMLSEMLNSTGEVEEARQIVDMILEEDATNVSALKMRATWLIGEDKSSEAIVALRTALNQNPEDTQTLTLLAMAHEREGDINLMGERLALAVEVSDAGPAEAVRYARFLMTQDRPVVAASVLEDSRRANPGNLPVLNALTNLRMAQGDWDQAEELVQIIRALDTESARNIAGNLEIRILQGQNRTDESLDILQELVTLGAEDGPSDQNIRAAVQIVQTQLRSGNVTGARNYLDEAMETFPDAPDLELLDASLHALTGNLDKAEVTYRDLIDRFPQSELPVRLLMSILNSTDRQDEAQVLLNEALERMPETANLLWVQASLMEQKGDIDGAVAIYERLYAVNSSNPVVANNLASLLATYRDDEQSLLRAATIARRLRNTETPPFQDTYGWVAYRRGNYEEAVRYLEPAARALSTDPIVQYHLGMTYAALNRTEEARAQLTRALEMAGDSPLPQFTKARETLATLPQ